MSGGCPFHDADHQFLVAAATAAGWLDLDFWVRLAEALYSLPHELVDRHLSSGWLEVGDFQHVFPRAGSGRIHRRGAKRPCI